MGERVHYRNRRSVHLESQGCKDRSDWSAEIDSRDCRSGPAGSKAARSFMNEPNIAKVIFDAHSIRKEE